MICSRQGWSCGLVPCPGGNATDPIWRVLASFFLFSLCRRLPFCLFLYIICFRQGRSCGLVHCPGGNATEPIWRVLASSLGVSSWTPLKPQYSIPNPNPLANQLWCIDFFTPPSPLIIPHRLLVFLESLMPLKSLESLMPWISYASYVSDETWPEKDLFFENLRCMLYLKQF